MYQKSIRRLMCLLMTMVLLVSTALPAFAAQEPNIHAASGIVIDYETGDTLYAKDADTMRVPASMTKIMTAYIIFEELEAGRLTLDTMVPVSQENADKSRSRNYPAMVPLTAGASYSVDTFLKLILIPSASASCIVMAEYIAGSEQAFVQRMNETAARLGMTAAYENCHGAHPHYVTARSIAILVRSFIQRFPQILNYTSLTGFEFEGRTLPNTNHLLTKYYYEGCDGFKTGTIKSAGYCLSATAERDGRRVIAVVMKSDNNEHRHSDAAALLDYGFQSLKNESRYFHDIGRHWARPQIEELSSSGIALHTRNGYFRPNAQITRAEFVAMMISAMEPRGLLDSFEEIPFAGFTDIKGNWAEAELERAAELGLIGGYMDGSFRPDAGITREEAMVFLDRAMQLTASAGLTAPDAGQISDWALDSVNHVVAAGLFHGDGAGNLHPGNNLLRGEAASVFFNLIHTS